MLGLSHFKITVQVKYNRRCEIERLEHGLDMYKEEYTGFTAAFNSMPRVVQHRTTWCTSGVIMSSQVKKKEIRTSPAEEVKATAMVIC